MGTRKVDRWPGLHVSPRHMGTDLLDRVELGGRVAMHLHAEAEGWGPWVNPDIFEILWLDITQTPGLDAWAADRPYRERRKGPKKPI